MIKKSIFAKIASVTLSVAMLATLTLPNINSNMFMKTVNADNLPITKLGAGSIGTGTTSSEAAKLPRANTQGTHRFTTEDYNKKHQALDTNDWASNWLWDLEGDKATDATDALTGTAYAFPLSYLMKKDGLRITKPSMTSSATNISAYNIKDNDTLCDFKFAPDWKSNETNIDEITDWSYEAITKNPSNSSQQMKTIMTQGSPFTYLELKNTNIMYIEKLRVTFPSDTIFEGVYNGSKMVVFRTNDITSSVNGYPGLTYQYYALFLPEGANIEHLGTEDKTHNDRIGKLKITLPSDKTYLSFAWIDESASHNDDAAVNLAKEYRPYAFNFITDTRADYSYNEKQGEISTTYKYTVERKAESTADGTIMGILPHQYKNMSGYSYMTNDAVTVRGRMKFMQGSSYTTKMKYKGILPYMPYLLEDNSAERKQLQSYVDEFMNQHMSGSGDWTLANDQGNETYYHGKKLNRAAQVVAAAKTLGDEKSADKVLDGLKANLEEWFTYSGPKDGNYFTYLGEGVGVLLGFPTSFNAVDQFNDHHFHYGYFIQSAACVGLWDKEWLNQYKDVVKQLIYDIACPYRDNADSVADCGNAYPYLRSFSPYEGHSWASGYEDERTGNNQESTSEAINAWAGIILYGELTGDTRIRDMGIYLYTTEVAAADNYWFDIDQDIYKIEQSKYQPLMASMVWGGKVDYSTWFGQNCTQGIQICPMQSWSFYLLDGGADYVKKFYNYDKTSELAKNPQSGEIGSTGGWNDMWASYYALADPEAAMNDVWTKKVVNDGESKAHTYHYIQSLIDYGTPDISFTSDSTFSSVFKKNGEYTYAVYNPDNTTKNVTFRDSTGKAIQVKATPNGMTLFNSKNIGKPSYTIEYYVKDLNSDDYHMIDSAIQYADAGALVTAKKKEFVGYSFDTANVNNQLSGNVNSDNSLVLKVYYTRNTYNISYELNGGQKTNATLYPESYIYGETCTLDSPTRNGYDFYGWYADEVYDTKIPSITEKTNGNLTLYAKWIPKGTILINEDVYLTFDADTKGTFTIIGDSGYSAVNVLYKIVQTEGEAAELAEKKAENGFVSWGLDRNSSGWTRTEKFKSNSGKYIVFYFIRYDSKGGYKTSYGYGKIGAGYAGDEPTSTEPITTAENPTDEKNTSDESQTPEISTEEQTNAEDIPLEVFGQVITSKEPGLIWVVWGQSNEQINLGQRYNIYIDGEIAVDTHGKRLESVGCIGRNIPASAGTHNVRITAVLNGIESKGVSADVVVTGGEIETTEEETPKETTEKETPEETTEKETPEETTEKETPEETTEKETQEETTEEETTIKTTPDIEINGFQVSATCGGLRTVYSIEPTINDKEVTEVGLLYGLSEYADKDDMSILSDSAFVKAFRAEIGKFNEKVSESDTASTYVMTMKFVAGTKLEFNAEWMVRAYAKLSDGTYAYSDVKCCSIYKVAEYVYNSGKMPTYDGHTYLYDKILTVVNPDFEMKEFDWKQSTVK